MGYRADANDDIHGAAPEPQEPADAAEPSGGLADSESPEAAARKEPTSKRGIFLLLGGLVVAGIAAGWSWVRGLPRDEP